MQRQEAQPTVMDLNEDDDLLILNSGLTSEDKEGEEYSFALTDDPVLSDDEDLQDKQDDHENDQLLTPPLPQVKLNPEIEKLQAQIEKLKHANHSLEEGIKNRSEILQIFLVDIKETAELLNNIQAQAQTAPDDFRQFGL